MFSERDYAATMHGRGARDAGVMPRDDDDLVGRIMAAITSSAEWEWLRWQISLDKRAMEEETTSEASGSGPYRHNAGTAGSAVGNTYTPGEVSGSGDYSGSGHSGDGSRSGIDMSGEMSGRRHAPVRLRESRGHSGSDYSGSGADEWQDEVDEYEPTQDLAEHEQREGRALRSRHRYGKRGSVRVEYIGASRFEQQADGTWTDQDGARWSNLEWIAMKEVERRHTQRNEELSRSLKKMTDAHPPQEIDTGVRYEGRFSDLETPEELQQAGREWEESLLAMDRDARKVHRAVKQAARDQLERYARRERERSRQFIGIDWMNGPEGAPRFNKLSALVAAKACLESGEPYERVVAQMCSR